MSSMTAVLRCICALSAGALVGMSLLLGGSGGTPRERRAAQGLALPESPHPADLAPVRSSAHYLVIETGSLRRSVNGWEH